MMQATEPHAQTGEATGASQPKLRTLVVCDLADSTALVERLGDQKAANLLRKHDRLTRALIEKHGGREIDKTDGFLSLFERPIQAVAFALDYQRGLQHMSATEDVRLSARVGIHVGDVMMWENTAADVARGAKPFEVEGLVKPVAARLAALAHPRQILLSEVAATIARRSSEDLGDRQAPVRWKSHGRYRFKGLTEAIPVFEIGDPRVASFQVPRSHGNAHKVEPWWRRTTVLAMVACILVLLAAAVAWWRINNTDPQLDFSARDWVVVGSLQNQTGDTGFDAAVDTALRIGLQQSHYVNVISNEQVRQTLARMERPEDTNVDRVTGSEVALRQHAKALILPSVTNYGDGVRISAELVDPKSQRTVATASAVSAEQDNVVATVDSLVKKLRGKLGETLAQITSSSVPLANATTSNLEALRAYSLSENARGRGDIQLSLSLLNHALKLDPNFALAHATVAANYISLDQHGPAKQAIGEALTHSERLSYIESALLQAQKVTIEGTSAQRVEAWKVMADLYPDNPIGAQNTGLAFSAYLNDCESALPYLDRAAELPQPMHAASRYTAATCELSLGKTEKAIKHFKAAAAAGFSGPFLGLADAYIATRQYGEAKAFLDSVQITDDTIINLTLRRALIASDVGDAASAESILQQGLQSLKEQQLARDGWRLKLDLIGTLWVQGKLEDALSHTRTDLTTLLAMNKQEQGRLTIDYLTLVASYSRWSARLGDAALANKGISSIRSTGALKGFPIREQLVAIAEAELALRRGRAADAVRIAEASDVHPLWELLEIIARAKTAAGQPDARAAVNRALNARYLAFGELYENNLGICTRAMQLNWLQTEASSRSRKNGDATVAPATHPADHIHQVHRTEQARHDK